MTTRTRRPNSVKRFNEYVNKVIDVYRETGEFKGEELGKEYMCRRIFKPYLTSMGILSLDRHLTIEETEAMYQYRCDPCTTPLPIFGVIEEDAHEMHDETLFTNANENANEVQENAPSEPTNLLMNIIDKTKNIITNLFKRKNANGFYVQGRQDGDTTTFVWNNGQKKIDFVLVLRKNKVVECRRVEEGDAIHEQVFDKIDVKQVFRAVSCMKYEYDKIEQENKVLRAKIDAIAQVLLIENEKNDTKTKKEPNLFGEYE